jgi:peptidyl-tRNA hydrolase
MKTKMYCVFSKLAVEKMNGIRGKLAAMAGHAFLHAFLDSKEKNPDSTQISNYINDPDSMKIVCVVDTELQLQKIFGAYNTKSIGTHLVTDAGYTVFKEPTVVCLGIGPLYDYESKPLENLKLLK